MMNIFLGHLWIFELTQKYLNWSHLNAIYILNGPNILKLFVEVWNSLSNIHNNFQNLLKDLVPKLNQNKQNKIKKNRK